jgi:hypothetical protein
MTWAQRLKRVFNIDIETCPKCGGTVKVIASIEDPAVIEKILAPLDKKTASAEPSTLPPSRAPPQASLFDWYAVPVLDLQNSAITVTARVPLAHGAVSCCLLPLMPAKVEHSDGKSLSTRVPPVLPGIAPMIPILIASWEQVVYATYTQLGILT